MPKIKSFCHVGAKQTFDIEVDHPDHQFYLASGLLTSNSHAISYAVDSYQCAWLLSYAEPEWLVSYMQTQEGNPDKRSIAISEIRALGYKIMKVDINHAADTWTIMPDKRLMPSFLTIKGMGEAAVRELILRRPYKTVYDLLWNDDGSWKHSKFNKRAFESLIKLGAFSSMDLVGPGKMFSSYKQMHAVLIEGQSRLKHKKRGRDELEKLLQETAGMPEWTKSELIEMSKEILGTADMSIVISQQLLDKLDKLKIVSVDDMEKDAICWFIADSVVPKISKNKKHYLLINAMGLGGKTYRLYCWGWNPERDEPMEKNCVYIAPLSVWDGGLSTSLFKVRKLSVTKEN